MSLEGSGTGAVTYRISGGEVIQARCAAEAAQDSENTLFLRLAFEDATHGSVKIEVSVPNYSADRAAYSNPSVSTGSASLLYINQIAGGHAYSGFLQGRGGDHAPFELQFASFTFSALKPGLAADSQAYSLTGTGAGTITYAFNTNPIQTQTVSVTLYSFYAPGFYPGTGIYAVLLELLFSDPVYGTCSLVVEVNPFLGTGIYDSSAADQLVSITTAVSTIHPGVWSCGNGFPSASVDAIYSETDGVVTWQGTLVATAVPFLYGNTTEPNLNMNLSALALTIYQDE